MAQCFSAHIGEKLSDEISFLRFTTLFIRVNLRMNNLSGNTVDLLCRMLILCRDGAVMSWCADPREILAMPKPAQRFMGLLLRKTEMPEMKGEKVLTMTDNAIFMLSDGIAPRRYLSIGIRFKI